MLPPAPEPGREAHRQEGGVVVCDVERDGRADTQLSETAQKGLGLGWGNGIEISGDSHKDNKYRGRQVEIAAEIETVIGRDTERQRGAQTKRTSDRDTKQKVK